MQKIFWTGAYIYVRGQLSSSDGARNAKKKRLEDFQDFVNIVDICGQSIVMDYHDFFEIPYGVSQAKYTASKPKLKNIQSVKFDKGSKRMFWKTSHTQEEFYSSHFSKESSLKVLEMISSEFKSPEVSVPTKKKTLFLCFALISRNRGNYFGKPFLSMTKQLTW